MREPIRVDLLTTQQVSIAGETYARSIAIDIAPFEAEFPGGRAELLFQRPDGQVYPLDCQIDDDGLLTAELTALETEIPGIVRFELDWYQDERIAKSQTYAGFIQRSLGAAGSAPQEQPTWVDTVLAGVESVRGMFPEEGETGDVLTKTATGAEWAPSQGGGGTADHTQLTNRDAANQHPMSAITGLVDALAAKGTYSKPSGGIPATDMESYVQMALSAAESAVQPGDLSDVATSGSYNDLVNKPTIPSEYDDTAVKARLDTIEGKEAGWDAKQEAISDLATIRSNAAAVSSKADASALTSHTGNGDIHVTAAQKTAWSGKQDAISDLSAIRSGAAAGATAYQKPSSGIPDSDIASASAWGAKYSKPSGGIPASDLTSEVQSTLTAVSGKQSVTIDDSAGYYTTDTVEGALAEIGAELAGINTLIGSGVI